MSRCYPKKLLPIHLFIYVDSINTLDYYLKFYLSLSLSLD